MATIFKVTVRADYRWNDAQVGGKIFSKKAVVEMAEADMTDEIRNSSLLEITEVNDAEISKEVAGESQIKETEGDKQEEIEGDEHAKTESAVLEGAKGRRRGHS